MTGDTLLTTGEIARLLRVKRARVSAWCNRGWLESIRTPGGHRRVRADALKEALSAGRLLPK